MQRGRWAKPKKCKTFWGAPAWGLQLSSCRDTAASQWAGCMLPVRRRILIPSPDSGAVVLPAAFSLCHPPAHCPLQAVLKERSRMKQTGFLVSFIASYAWFLFTFNFSPSAPFIVYSAYKKWNTTFWSSSDLREQILKPKAAILFRKHWTKLGLLLLSFSCH